MKYKYLSGRSIIPDGIKSPKLTCHECNKPQSRSYRTECNKNICYSCKVKDENGSLESELKEKN